MSPHLPFSSSLLSSKAAPTPHGQQQQPQAEQGPTPASVEATVAAQEDRYRRDSRDGSTIESNSNTSNVLPVVAEVATTSHSSAESVHYMDVANQNTTSTTVTTTTTSATTTANAGASSSSSSSVQPSPSSVQPSPSSVPPPSIKMLSYAPLLHGLVQLQLHNNTHRNKNHTSGTSSSTTTVSSDTNNAATSSSASTGICTNPSTGRTLSSTRKVTAQGTICQWWKRRHQHPMKPHITKISSRNNVVHTGNPAAEDTMMDRINTKKRSRSFVVMDESNPTKRIKWSPSPIDVSATSGNDFEETMLSHRHWVWNLWQSYSDHERYLATKLLIQWFLDWTSLSSVTERGSNGSTEDTDDDDAHDDEVIFYRRYEFIRSLIIYIQPYIYRDTHDQIPVVLPNLIEWCATFQFVLMHNQRSDATVATTVTMTSVESGEDNNSNDDDNDGVKNTVNVGTKFRFSNEMVAIVYHYWPWLCETLWVFLNGNSLTTIKSLSYPQHVLTWIQMLYTLTIAAADQGRNTDLGLPALQLLNRQCLWNTKLLRISETHTESNHTTIKTASVATPSHHYQQSRLPSTASLSPLAYLIASFYRIKDSMNDTNHWSGRAMRQAQQLLGEMIQYRTSVRMMKTAHMYGKTTADLRQNNDLITTKTSKDDATLSSIKTTKAGNASTSVRGLNSSDTVNKSSKEVMIRFAEEEEEGDDDNNDDDVDHDVEKNDDMGVIDTVEATAHCQQSKRDDSITVSDELQSIIMQSDHSSDNSCNLSIEDDDDSQDDDHTIIDGDDNDTISRDKHKASDTGSTGAADDTTTKTSGDAADKREIATKVATGKGSTTTENVKVSNSTEHETTTNSISATTATSSGMLHDSETMEVDGEEKDDDDDDDDDDDNDDEDDPIPDDDDDDDDFVDDYDEDAMDAMDFVELDPFICDDSLHRYRTTFKHQKGKSDEEEDEGPDASEIHITNRSTSKADKDDVANGATTSDLKDVASESDTSLIMVERRKLYVLASMQVLALQHCCLDTKNQIATSFVDKVDDSGIPSKYLSISSENELIGSINKVVKPPTKPIVSKILLRRAPTQEEFFRGSLSRNPVPVNMLLNNDIRNNAVGTRTNVKNSDEISGCDKEATIYDLRQYIANDLQMSDSAELIEIIVANKILDVNLKIRVVQQVLWKKSLIDNPSGSRDHRHESTLGALLASSAGSGLFSGSAMSFIFSSAVDTADSNHSRGHERVTADTPLTQLPPMIATYRLAGVDGEATEETVGVSDLIDPEAISDSASPEERDARLEAEFGMTMYVTCGRGVEALLRSVQEFVNDILRRIRRDSKGGQTLTNPAKVELMQCPPCQGLILLRHCAKLAINRKRMLQARAPGILLALLIDILKVLEETSVTALSSTLNDGNPTSEILQELIEMLTSDISRVGSGDQHNVLSQTGTDIDMTDKDSDTANEDASSMSLLLQSIETIALSSPLRIVVAKLLPFLTYGQTDLCRELALHFDKHLTDESLIDWEKQGNSSSDDHNTCYETKNSILTNTFIQTALILPTNDVCDSLRIELINCRIVESIVTFITRDKPDYPAPWTPALWPAGELAARNESPDVPNQQIESCVTPNTVLEEVWREFYKRLGVRTAIKVLIGLCRSHVPTQSRIALQHDFVRFCHWLESTSDSTSVSTNGIGCLAETLLDEMISGNHKVGEAVKSIRNNTRLRKKELAQEQRNKALQKISSFGGISNIDSSKALFRTQTMQPNTRQGLASLLAPVVGLFKSAPESITSRSNKAVNDGKSTSAKPIPSWLSEVEEMQDEIGLTCAVCQEGSNLQPSELLGLYVFVKKVSISIDHGGSCTAIDGANLLAALPPSLPESLLADSQSALISEWFATTQSVVVNMFGTNSSKSASSSSRHRQYASYTTSVTAGNGIHYSCHRRARQADRSHPKAPKSEWDGAALRNSRVRCNAILPIVHGPNQSKIPLVSMESALSDHSETLSKLHGASLPRSALWSVLHDLRLLLLRISYNESLNVDCGGGSLASNCQLIYHQIYMARMRDRNAAMVRYDHQSEHSLHAHGLAAAVLLATTMVNTNLVPSKPADTGSSCSSVLVLIRHLADAATMGALASVIFPVEKGTKTVDSTTIDSNASASSHNITHNLFLQALIVCAGRRHACGITGSGCLLLTTEANDDDGEDDDDDDEGNDTEHEQDEEESCTNAVNVNSTLTDGNTDKTQRQTNRAGLGTDDGTTSTLVCDDFKVPLRPLITYYLILCQVHADLTTGPLSEYGEDTSKGTDDPIVGAIVDPIETCVERLVTLVNSCWKCSCVQELISKLPESLSCTEDVLLKWFQLGMQSSS